MRGRAEALDLGNSRIHVPGLSISEFQYFDIFISESSDNIFMQFYGNILFGQILWGHL